jgi:apolipoprotein N-acyltransferase
VAALIGALTPLAFAPYQIWPIAILSVSLFLGLLHNQSRKKATFIGFAWGAGLFGFGISWVHVSIDTFGGMPKVASFFLMFMLVCYLALYPALFAWSLTRFLAKSTPITFILGSAILWLIWDWARGWVLTGFPWLQLGYSQIDSPLSSLAPIGGVDLVTFALVIISASITAFLIHKRWMFSIIPIGLFVLSLLLSSIDWVIPDETRSKSVALIQGNIDQSKKWLPTERWPTMMKYMDLTRENWDADIIIWPEAAIPAFEREVQSFLYSVDAAAKLNESAVITGVVTYNDDLEYYNSVIALGQTPYGDYDYQTHHRYHKHHLLPFGEFVPLESLLRPLAPLFNLPMSSFSRGDYVQENLIANNQAMTPALCYEIIFNELVRANTTDETDYILTLSNDAWFGQSIGPLQHMEIARMRALELGKPVVRSTNNGVTAVTDHTGKITAQIPQFVTAVLKADVTPTDGKTPYLTYGTIPMKVLFALVVVVFVGGRLRVKG